MSQVETSDPPRLADTRKTTGPEVYEGVWAEVRARISAEIANGETSLSRILRKVWSGWLERSGEPSQGLAYGRRVQLPSAALLGACDGLREYAALSACRPDTSLVVEIGAGWGHGLLRLWLAGGPRDAEYWALEPTSSGRSCVETLAALEPALRLSSAPFDYLEPDFGVLPRNNRHVLVTTWHSIEQIKLLPREAITQLFDLGDAVTVVHFEPVGWQMRPDDTEIASRRQHSTQHDYNENLWPILTELHDAGEIRIVRAEPDLIAHKVKRGSSLIVWERGRDGLQPTAPRLTPAAGAAISERQSPRG